MKSLIQKCFVVFSLFAAMLVFAALPSCLSDKSPKEENTEGGTVPKVKNGGEPAAVKPALVFETFIPSGWMGDGEDPQRRYLEMDESWTSDPHLGSACVKITYKKAGPANWAGIYWQNVPNNFCKSPGEDFSGKGFTKITFWAKGKNGGEIAEFKAGGIKNCNNDGLFEDSFETRAIRVNLETTWKEYTIDLAGMDLTSVIGGFCWSSPKPSTIYIDDVMYH